MYCVHTCVQLIKHMRFECFLLDEVASCFPTVYLWNLVARCNSWGFFCKKVSSIGCTPTVDLTTCEGGGTAQPIQFTSDNCHVADAPIFIENPWVGHLQDLVLLRSTSIIQCTTLLIACTKLTV